MPDDVAVNDQGRRLGFGVVIGGLALVALLLFVFQNTDDTPIKFLTFDGTMPLFLLLLITFGLSVIVTLFGIWILRRRS